MSPSSTACVHHDGRPADPLKPGRPRPFTLRIHFTAADIARTHVACKPDLMWETVLSLHVLQSRRRAVVHQQWSVAATRRATERGLAASIKHLLFPLAPVASYFPDFLTPSEGAEDVTSGIEAVVSTPRSTMLEQFAFMASRTPVPAWSRRLADGDRELRGALEDSLRSYYATMLAPWMDKISQSFTTDRDMRMRTLAKGGVAAVLEGLSPVARWDGSTLAVPYPRELDIHLNGRGLRLIPSYFCTRMPVALVDPSMQPVLVYPAAEWLPAPSPSSADCDRTALENLLGTTRAAILLAIGEGATSKQLAADTGVGPATISHHTAVLREAGLITTRRVGNTVVHALTPKGAHLIGRSDPCSTD